MSPVQLTSKYNRTAAKIDLLGKEVHLYIRTTDDKPYHAELAARRIVRPAVQEKLLHEYHINLNDVKMVNINPEPMKDVMLKNGVLNLSLKYALALRGSKTAIVLSGGADKGLSHAGAMKAIDSLGIKVDYILGASAGSIIASLYSHLGSGEAVRKLILDIIQKYSWQDLIDLNITGIRNFGTYNGVIKGNKIINIISQEAGLKGVKLSDMSSKIPLFMAGVDLNSGREYIFSGMGKDTVYDQFIEDPRYPIDVLERKYVPSIFPEDVNVADAIRSSIAIPGIFQPRSMETGNKSLDFTDGGVRENCPIRTAACLIDVDKILAINLGYTGEQKGRFADMNVASIILQAFALENWTQMDALYDPIFNGTSVRVINPGLFNIDTPECFERAQDIMISSEDTIKRIFAITSPNKKAVIESFFHRWKSNKIYDLQNEFRIDTYPGTGQPEEPKYSLTDIKSMIMDPKSPKWEAYYMADGSRVIPKQADKSVQRWLFNEMKESQGLGWTLFFGGIAGILNLFFFKKNDAKVSKDLY